MKLLFVLFFTSYSFAFQTRVMDKTNTCLQCHGDQKPIFYESNTSLAPILPHRYSMDWLMYEFKSNTPPPFKDIPTPHKVNRGKTYYNWLDKQMTEIYYDLCINIFPDGNQFSCQFISKGGETYFIKYELKNLEKVTSCCLWSESEFYAPRPDVLQNFNFQKQTTWDDRKTNWWIYDIPLPGPFGYGTSKDSSTPVAFWFPVIDAWVQQNFYGFTTTQFDSNVFSLPVLCKAPIKVCK